MLDYKSATIDDLIEWCKANNQVEWLKAKAAEQVEVKVYPKVKMPVYDKVTGEPVMKDGEQVYKTKANKKAKPHTEVRAISYLQIRKAFFEKFMPDAIPQPKNPKKDTLSMWDKINAL